MKNVLQTIRFYLKIAISYTIYYSGIFVFLKFLKRRNPVVLCYHKIVENLDQGKEDSLPGLLVSGEAFKKQLEFLKNCYKVISMDDFLKHIKNDSFPDSSAVITFDDGYSDNYTHAFPVLKSYMLPATVFLTTDFIEYQRQPEWEPQNRLSEKTMLSWDEIKEMHKNNISFGAHTQSHPVYGKDAENNHYREIEQSKRIIEKRLDTKIGIFAFPKGIYNKKALKTAKNAGYKMVFSLDKNDRNFVFGRIPINEGMYKSGKGKFHLPIFACAILGLWNKNETITNR